MGRGFSEYWHDSMRWRETHSVTDKEFILYVSLLDIFSRWNQSQWMEINTVKLMLLTNTTNKRTAYRARDALIEAGFLEYRLGKKGKPFEYRLIKFGVSFDTENDSRTAYETETKNKTERV